MFPKAYVKIKVGEVRSDPREESVVVGGLNRGEVVDIIDDEGEWKLIQRKHEHTDMVVGWMKESDIEGLPF